MTSSINGRLRLLIVTILFGWMAATAESQQVSEQQPDRSAWPSITPGETAVTRNVRLALDKHTRMDFDETPLDAVVDSLKELHGIEIQLDTRALDKVGIGSDTPVTMRIMGVALRSALKLMLESMDKTLIFVIRNEVLWITTHDAEPVQRRVYNVAKLLGDQESATELAAALSGAIEMLGSHEVQITPFGRLLIVRGGQQSHDQLAELLAAMYQGITANQASDRRPKASPTDEQEHEHHTSESNDEP